MRTQSGFTLIELMVVVAVIAIIAAIAFPSYTESVKAGRRAAAVSGVADLQLQQERWRAENSTYAASGLTMPEASEFYTYGYTGGATYAATATPKGKQEGDSCGTLTASNTSKPKWTASSCDK